MGMKIFRMLLCAVFAVMVAACSQGAFNEKKCQELYDKINAGDTLSEAEVGEMIDQMEAIVDIYIEKAKEFDYDNAKFRQWEDSTEWLNMAKFGDAFNSYFVMSPLSAANQKKFDEASERIGEKFMKMQQEAMKKAGIPSLPTE